MIPNSINIIKVRSSHINDEKEYLHALSILIACLYIIAKYEKGKVTSQHIMYQRIATINVGIYHRYINTWLSLGLGFLIRNGINGTRSTTNGAGIETRHE